MNNKKKEEKAEQLFVLGKETSVFIIIIIINILHNQENKNLHK